MYLFYSSKRYLQEEFLYWSLKKKSQTIEFLNNLCEKMSERGNNIHSNAYLEFSISRYTFLYDNNCSTLFFVHGYFVKFHQVECRNSTSRVKTNRLIFLLLNQRFLHSNFIKQSYCIQFLSNSFCRQKLFISSSKNVDNID